MSSDQPQKRAVGVELLSWHSSWRFGFQFQLTLGLPPQAKFVILHETSSRTSDASLMNTETLSCAVSFLPSVTVTV